jgi:lipid A 3-O-deacylase
MRSADHCIVLFFSGKYAVMLKRLFPFLMALLSLPAMGQNGFRHMVGFVSDNDKYSSFTQDRYYTNGLTLQYDFLSKKASKKAVKTIWSFAVGQYIYTPYRAYVPRLEDQDRPFAGYLFFNFAFARFYKNNGFYRLTFQAGVLGPASQAETIQRWLHKTFHLSKVAGWEYQIHNQPGINFYFFYLKNLAVSKSRIIDFNLCTNLSVGTIFDDAAAGFITRIGIKPLHAVSNTFLFHSNLSNDARGTSEKELYFFVKFQAEYVAYNATLQGSMFHSESPLTFPPERFKAGIQAGLVWSIHHFNLIYAVSWFTKAVDNNRVKPHNYGTIALAFRF